MSPRLRSVRNQADADALWAEVALSGTPLVETEPGSLSFLWRDDGATERVAVVGGPAIWDPIENDLMERIPGTDVWFKTYPLEDALVARYFLSPNDSLAPLDDVTDWLEREKTFRTDPLNPRSLHWPRNPADPGDPPHDMSVIALREGVITADEILTAPRLVEHEITSEHLGNSRRVWARATRRTDGSRRLVVMLDGWVWATALPVHDIVDRVEERGGPLVTVLVESLDEQTRDRELGCEPAFVRFLTEELVPWAHATYGSTGRAGIVGQSLGGLAAVYAAITAPTTFGVAGAQSGSFWWPRDEHDRPQEELVDLVRRTDRVDVRLHFETGALEGEDMIGPAERIRDALTARGYSVDYRTLYGGHDWLRWHTDLGALLERMQV